MVSITGNFKKVEAKVLFLFDSMYQLLQFLWENRQIKTGIPQENGCRNRERQPNYGLSTTWQNIERASSV